jgi:hypothetical protein
VEGSKSRNQDTVGNFPVLLTVMSCEETIVDTGAKFFESYSDGFAEALFVADFSK